MKSQNKTVSVPLLDRNYDIRCAADEVTDLVQAAAYLDQKMREFAHRSGRKDVEHIPLMAALTLSHELLLARRQINQQEQQINDQIDQLSHRVSAVLDSNETKQKA